MKGGRISLTGMEAALLRATIGTCREIAQDTALYHRETHGWPVSDEQAGTLWDRIIDKLDAVTPDVHERSDR